MQRASLLLALFLVSVQCEFFGDLTYYTSWRGNYGSCGLERSKHDPYYVAALSKARMSGAPNPNKHPLCAKNHCIKITGARGSLKLKISDTCWACQYNDVDIADTLFHFVDDPAKGRVKIHWSFVDCGNLLHKNNSSRITINFY